MKSQEIREAFKNYFVKNQHKSIKSSSLVPENDNTLLFANAGMNQFKDYFTGRATPDNKRAVTIQKVVRAGGKHNDLENVGLTARHNTFFEMLGNFSFGDYFKEESIHFAWEFLTKELSLSKDKLYVSVHPQDDQARQIWHKQIGLPIERIFDIEDNFWEMGDTGPCGPNSEIFYDHGEAFTEPGFKYKPGQCLLDDEGRYVEIWNLVFMQYERTLEGQFDLPTPSIDTGAGLERVAAVMQGKYWNYDTDLFFPIIQKLESLSGREYSDPKITSSFRVVADHIRSATMLITDGVIPSNEGRGYVLRRIIRRAIRHLNELGLKDTSFYQLIPTTFEILGAEYPQNLANQSLAENMLKLEEEKFQETLGQGLKYLEESIQKDVQNKTLPGASAFKLYDTYGFPVDLTETILQERGLLLDDKGFHQAMQRRKEESKKNWSGGSMVDTKVFHTSLEKSGPTQFLGYDQIRSTSKLLDIIEFGEMKGLVFDKTPFYGESGGQEGDEGHVLFDGDALCKVEDTQKPLPELFVHIVKEADSLKVGKSYTLEIDVQKRELTKRNHSCAHLLQSALIEVLGDHVKQAGSLVNEHKVRFDFTHHQAVTKDELIKIETLVNENINNSLSVSADQMSMDEALQKGAMALFGEKYGDKVRVLSMGKFSTELCGGTHVDNTAEIGHFVLTGESSLSTGVRRIEGLTSHGAIDYLRNRSSILKKIESMTIEKEEGAASRIETLFKDNKELSKEVKSLKEKIQAGESKNVFEKAQSIKGFPFLSHSLEDAGALRKFSDLFVDKFPKGILFLSAIKGDKASCLLRAGKESQIDCSKVFKSILENVGGRGGGRKDMSQGSAPADKVDQIEKMVRESLENEL